LDQENNRSAPFLGSNLKLYVPVYTLIIASIYHFGFWSRFNVNVLEFVGISDLLALAVFPLIASITAFVLGFTVSVIQSLVRGRRVLSVIALGTLLAIGVSYFFGAHVALTLTAFALVLFVSSRRLKLNEVLGDPKVEGARILVLSWLVFLFPALSFGYGISQADLILAGKKYVSVKLSGSEYRYVGFVKDKYFLYSPSSKSVTIAPISEVGVLELRSSPELGERPSASDRWNALWND